MLSPQAVQRTCVWPSSCPYLYLYYIINPSKKNLPCIMEVLLWVPWKLGSPVRGQGVYFCSFGIVPFSLKLLKFYIFLLTGLKNRRQKSSLIEFIVRRVEADKFGQGRGGLAIAGLNMQEGRSCLKGVSLRNHN